MVYFHIVMFLLFQVGANLLFKWGGTDPRHYWWGFAFGNLVGASSIVFLLGMYRAMPAAAVIAIGTGGTFLLNQIVINAIYRERLSGAAVVGLALIFVGILMTALLNDPKSPARGTEIREESAK